MPARCLNAACCLLLSRLAEQLNAKLQELGGGGGALATVVTPHAVNHSQLLTGAAAAAVPFQVVPSSSEPAQSEGGPIAVERLQQQEREEEEDDDDDDEVERFYSTDQGCEGERDEATQVCGNSTDDATDDMSELGNDAKLGNDDEIAQLIDELPGWGATPAGVEGSGSATAATATVEVEERAILQEFLVEEGTRRRSSRLRQRTEAPAQVAPPPARRQRTAARTPTTTYRSLGDSAEADQAPPAFRSLGSSPCTVAVDDELDESVFRSAATGEDDEEAYELAHEPVLRSAATAPTTTAAAAPAAAAAAPTAAAPTAPTAAAEVAPPPRRRARRAAPPLAPPQRAIAMTTLGAIAREMLRQRRDKGGAAARAGCSTFHLVGHGSAAAAAGAAAGVSSGVSSMAEELEDLRQWIRFHRG